MRLAHFPKLLLFSPWISSFALSVAIAGAEEEPTVVVHGSHAPRSASDPETSVGIVSGEDLREPGIDAADVLQGVPGVQVTRTGSSADLSTVSIRGAESSQVPVYLAGIRLNDDVVGVADLSRLPVWMLDRVEVYRSVAPLRATRSSMGGALFFEPTLPSEGGYRLGAQAGSFGSGAFWMGGTMNHVSDDPDALWSTSFALRRSGARNDFSFQSDEGTAFFSGDDEVQVRTNADYVETDMWALSRGNIPAGRGAVSIVGIFNHLERQQGVSGLSLLPAQSARSALTRDLAGVSSRAPCPWGKVCLLSLATSFSGARLETTDPNGELSLGASRFEQLGQRFSEQVQMDIEHSHALSTAFATSLESSRLLLDADENPLSRAEEVYLGALGSLKFSPEPDRFVRVALRASCVEADGVDGGVGSAVATDRSWSQCQPEGRVGAYKGSRASEVFAPWFIEEFGFPP